MGLLNVQITARRTVSTYFAGDPLLPFEHLTVQSQGKLSLRYGRAASRLIATMAAADHASMKILPDPRLYAPLSPNLLVNLAQQASGQGCAMQHEKLVVAIGQALQAGDDLLIGQALIESPSCAAYRTLTRALDAALKAPGDAALHLRLFAIPILLVTGGSGPMILPGVVADVGELTKLFELHGTLGPMRNFGLSGTLVSAAGLAALKPSTIYRRSRETGQDNFAPLDLPPEDIRITGTEEKVHLRFLTGVSVTSADAPGFTETAGNVGAWGMPLTRALAAQLGQPGLSLLPIPRPPMSPLRALEAGRYAESELGFQLFLQQFAQIPFARRRSRSGCRRMRRRQHPYPPEFALRRIALAGLCLGLATRRRHRRGQYRNIQPA